jgi:hypothetical protein
MAQSGARSRNQLLTHRFEITSSGEIDGEVRKWLKTAYELDALRSTFKFHLAQY